MDNRFIQNEDDHSQLPRPSAEKIHQLLPKRRRRKWPLVLVTIIVIATIAGGGAYAWHKKKQSPSAAPSSSTTQPTTAQPVAGQPIKATVPTETYTSSTLNISIKYPKGWVAAETNNKTTITSPVLALPQANGQQTGGQIVLTIQPKQTSLPAFAAGNALAVRDSEKLTYTNPSSMQRGQTYVSFLHYANSTGSQDSFDALYITGDAGYVAQQYIPKADVFKGDPLVSVTFMQCPDTTCSTQKSLTIPATAWDNPDFAGTIRPVLASLVVN